MNKNVLSILTLSLLLFSTQAWSRGGPPGPGKKGPPPHILIQEHATELGISQATADKVQAIARSHRTEVTRTRHSLQRERLALKQLLETENPNKAEVMAQVEVVGEARTQMRKLELSILIDIRALLSPDQLDNLRRLRRKMIKRRLKRGKRRGLRGPPGEAPGRSMKRGFNQGDDAELDNDWL